MKKIALCSFTLNPYWINSQTALLMVSSIGFGVPLSSYLLLVKGHGKKRKPLSEVSSIRCAEKRDPPESSGIQQSNNKAILPSLRVSSPVLARSALAVFALGFIDAGYSGDWSRIGAISREAEDLLKVAAFVVVPLCIFAILSVSEKLDT